MGDAPVQTQAKVKRDHPAEDSTNTYDSQFSSNSLTSSDLEENDEGADFSIWAVDEYFHATNKSCPVILRSIVEIFLLSFIMLLPIMLAITIDDGFKAAFDTIFKFDYTKSESWGPLVKKIDCFILWYAADTLIAMMWNSSFITILLLLKLFGLSDNVFCLGMAYNVFSLRLLGRLACSFFCAFLIMKDLLSDSEMDDLSPIAGGYLRIFVFWLSFYFFILFCVKLVILLLTFESKRASFIAKIKEVNYKLEIFRALERGKIDSDSVLSDSHANPDHGLFIKHSNFCKTPGHAHAITRRIFKRFNAREIDYTMLKEFFSGSQPKMFGYLTGQDNSAEMNKKKVIKRGKTNKLLEELVQKRINLESTLNDQDSIYAKLDFIVSAIATYCAAILLLILLNLEYKYLLTAMGAPLLTFSWIFADSIKNVYTCFVFLLIIRPYNIGDQVSIDGMLMNVHKIDLLTSTFLDACKKLVYISNTQLIAKTIFNITRSPPQIDVLELIFDENTKYKQALEIEEDASAKLKKYTSFFESCNLLSFAENKAQYEIRHCTNFHDRKLLRLRRNKIVKVVSSVLNEKHISYTQSFAFSE
ncbi:hypothetical protein ENBRE01_0639 [Enteropsectra breve]|nr:hypothetical protein ENBRE01_0639 [Enteropsectra breve]